MKTQNQPFFLRLVFINYSNQYPNIEKKIPKTMTRMRTGGYYNYAKYFH